MSNVQVLSRSNKAAGLEEFRLDFFLEEKKTLDVVLTTIKIHILISIFTWFSVQRHNIEQAAN